MAKYHTKYVKNHYVKRDIKRELYEAFIEWCGEKSINICLEKALNILRGNIQSNIKSGIQSEHSHEHSHEISTLNIQNSIKSDINSDTFRGNVSAGKQNNTVTKCFDRARMSYPVESYVAYYKSRGILVDWWEEGENRVCFELKTGAESSSGSGQHRKKLYRMRYEDGDESWLLQYAPEDWEKE
jgi:hypothetical protein